MRYRVLWGVLAVLLAAALLVGCGREASPPGEPTVHAASDDEVLEAEVLVVLNGRPLRRQQFEEIKAAVLGYYQQEYAQLGMDIRDLLQGPRGRLFELDLELAALDSLLADGVLLEEAERREITISQEEVEAEFEAQYARWLDHQAITEQQHLGHLAAQGSSLEAFKQEVAPQIEQQLLRDAVAHAVAGPIELAEDDLRAYFEERRAEYHTGAQVQASHILVADEAEGQELLGELADGTSFATLAREHSTCPSAAEGGDLGWFGRGMMVPEFEEVAFALEAGRQSDLVETRFGFHIILVTDRREEKEPQFDELREEIRSEMEQDIRNERLWAWMDGELETAEIVIKDPILNAWFTKAQDLDQGLAALTEVRAEGTPEGKYLAFIIGGLHEERIGRAELELADLRSEVDDDPEREALIAELEAQIEADRRAALAAHWEAVAELGELEEILSRIEALENKAPAGTP